MTDSIECVFVEIDKSVFGSLKNIIIGVVYRPPNSNLENFYDVLRTMLVSICREKKLCYILGDYNLDLLKSESHSLTKDFVNLMFEHSFVPLINRPTRVTRSSASLIDNIFTNDLSFSNSSSSGILLNDTSDHYPVFHLSTTNELIEKEIVITKRRITNETRLKFIDMVTNVDWSFVSSIENTQLAYSAFSEKYIDLYNRAFPKVNKKKSLITIENLGYQNRLEIPSRKRQNCSKNPENILLPDLK